MKTEEEIKIYKNLYYKNHKKERQKYFNKNEQKLKLKRKQYRKKHKNSIKLYQK